MKVVGFDFGTTNSLISFIEGNRAINILDHGMPFPSVVCYQGSQKIVGRKAKERLADASVSVIGNTVRSPKTLLGESKVFVEGVGRNPRDIVADIVGYVREQAIESDYPGEYDAVVVTIPIDMNGRRRAELREAFRQAGMRILQFVHEPLAALYGHLRSQPNFQEKLREFNRELLLVFDWGGGTLDLTLCQVLDGMLVQIRNDGCSDVGGDHIDAAIRNHILQQVFRERPSLAQADLQPRAQEKLLALAERAKIELSKKLTYPVYVSNFFAVTGEDPDLHYDLSREELEAVCAPFVAKGIGRIGKVLELAGIGAPAVAMCLATGGMANMPIIQSRLLEYFGPQRIQVSERGATIIAEGAAWIGHDERRLSLAKNVELSVAVNSYFPVIKAGTKMPREAEIQQDSFDMYCTDPRDGHAKFQLATPVRPGRQVIATDERAVLDNLSIRVHKDSLPFFERLRFDVSIDENLILTASAFSTMEKDREKVEIHNLEFGLELVQRVSEAEPQETEPDATRRNRDTKETISLRANVVEVKDRTLIPGDLLATLSRGRYDVNPFDRDRAGWATKRQHQEKLYYQPCSVCGRMINDPLCRCASSGPSLSNPTILIGP